MHDRQVRAWFEPELDGARRGFELRADYIVSRWGRRYVAEVKTGAEAPSLGHAPTRRQLLEYSVAFDVHGVLLVDIEAGSVHRVVFGRQKGWGSNLRWFVLGAAVAAVASAAAMRPTAAQEAWQGVWARAAGGIAWLGAE